MRLTLLLPLLLLPACASVSSDPRPCAGPAVAIDPQWRPTAAQTEAMNRIIKEACS